MKNSRDYFKLKYLKGLSLVLFVGFVLGFFSAKVQAQQFGGVGLLLDYYPPGSGQVVVYSVRYKSPADKANIKRSYRLVSVDGRNVTGMSLQQIAEIIRGPVGSPVQLALMNPQGQVQQYSLIRESISEKTEVAMPGVKGIDPQSTLTASDKALLKQKIQNLQTQEQQLRMLDLIKAFKNQQITKTKFLESLNAEFP